SKVEQQLLCYINQAQAHNMHIILMGDLNADAAKLSTITRSGSVVPKHLRFLQTLPSYDLVDTTAFLHDDVLTSTDDRYHTYIPSISRQHSSRLDYVFVSNSLLSNVIANKTYHADFVGSDHRFVQLHISSSGLFDLGSSAQRK